jgi:hypothetical protein
VSVGGTTEDRQPGHPGSCCGRRRLVVSLAGVEEAQDADGSVGLLSLLASLEFDGQRDTGDRSRPDALLAEEFPLVVTVDDHTAGGRRDSGVGGPPSWEVVRPVGGLRDVVQGDAHPQPCCELDEVVGGLLR